MTVLASRRTYATLAAFSAGDAVASAIPLPYIARTLDNFGVPERIRWMIPAAKATVTLGLLSVFRFPVLARITTALMTVYFAVAVLLHLRARDRAARIAPAVVLLAIFAAMTAEGPEAG